MDIYRAILEQAGGDARQGGDLHEELWTRLLRRENPRHHNVRVTRGDQGIDGIALTDPVLGEVSIYQAKFFDELCEEHHREPVRKSLAKAVQFPGKVTQWILLLPIDPSAREVAWIVSSLKGEVRNRLGASDQLDDLAIEYRTAEHLKDLCVRHLSNAAALLPNSTLALSQRLNEEATRNERLEREMIDRLRTLNEEAIRARRIESLRAANALRVLHQGWADHIGMLGMHGRDPQTSAAEIAACAEEVETFAHARTREAFDAEPLAPGVGHLVYQVYVRSRQLRSMAVQVQVAQAAGVPGPDAQMRAGVRELLGACREVLAFVYPFLIVR